MKKLTVTMLLLVLLFPVMSLAQGVDGIWVVAKHDGETWYAEKSEILGKTQEFEKGFSEGVFFQCNYAGLSMTYTKYTAEEFLKNREFELFKKLRVLGSYSSRVFVHRITCNGKRKNDRKVLYPFVTITPNWSKAFYLYEGGVFTLEYRK
jgi:hypothetical protein